MGASKEERFADRVRGKERSMNEKKETVKVGKEERGMERR